MSSKCIELVGGIGYTKDFPVEKFYRDCKVRPRRRRRSGLGPGPSRGTEEEDDEDEERSNTRLVSVLCG